MSILKEIPFYTGEIKIHMKKPRIAYVEQEAVIFSGTIQELITFGNPMS